jgi:hypothetical protein
MLTASILGSYFIHTYQNNIPKKILKIFKIFDIITHILPLLYIVFFMKRKKIETNKYDYLIIIITFLIGLIYIKLFNAKKIYYFTKYSNNKLLFISYFTFILFFYLLK